jgi:hypothetical protein
MYASCPWQISDRQAIYLENDPSQLGLALWVPEHP